MKLSPAQIEDQAITITHEDVDRAHDRVRDELGRPLRVGQGLDELICEPLQQP